MVSSLILVPAYTDLSADYSANKKLKREQVNKIVIAVMTLSLISMALFYFFSREVITFIYGWKYSQAEIVLSALVMAIPVLLLNNLTGVILNSSQKEFYPFLSALIGMAVNIPLAVTFIINFGIMGAAFSTIITEFVVLAVQVFYIFRLKIIT